ncbi:MAG: hypothetical protein IIX21_06095 [Clostridia bacterium]|nr:hypothetical protein [Clostridia bacterium]
MAAAGSGTFKNCFVKNSSLRNTNVRWWAEEYGVGGFIGWFRRMANVSDCYVINTKICAYGHSGSFIGWSQDSTGSSITNCYAANITRDTSGASGDLTSSAGRVRSFMMKDTNVTVTKTVSSISWTRVSRETMYSLCLDITRIRTTIIHQTLKNTACSTNRLSVQ